MIDEKNVSFHEIAKEGAKMIIADLLNRGYCILLLREDIKRIFAVYYEQNVTSEQLKD